MARIFKKSDAQAMDSKYHFYRAILSNGTIIDPDTNPFIMGFGVEEFTQSVINHAAKLIDLAHGRIVIEFVVYGLTRQFEEETGFAYYVQSDDKLYSW